MQRDSRKDTERDGLRSTGATQGGPGKTTLVASLPATTAKTTDTVHLSSPPVFQQSVAQGSAASAPGSGSAVTSTDLQPSDSTHARMPASDALASQPPGHADDVARAEYIYETAQQTGSGILSLLVPGYRAARDQCDAAAVAELGGRLVGAYSVVHGARSALGQMLGTISQHSTPGESPEKDLELAKRQQAVEAKIPLLDPLIRIVGAIVPEAMTPHVFRGTEVAGQAVVVALDGPPMQRTAKLTGELQRTVAMLLLVDDLRKQLLDGKKGFERTSLQAARTKLAPWASRPLDLAFLHAALGPIWSLLDATASPIEAKPSDVLGGATKQATHTGWLGDLGRVDIDNVCMELRIGGRQSAELVIGQLYTADPDTRAKLLIQIKERGLLDALCSAVGWADIKQLHDSLGYGFSEIKSDLQRYFIGKRGYGPGIGHEWEHHDSSLHGLVGRLGGPGAVLNFALDVGTFGFNSSYGIALDDRSEGRTSATEASRAKMHAAGRTTAIAAIGMLTGGLADKLVRGGAATVPTMRAIGANAAGGSAAGVAALGTADVYGNYVSDDQQGFSSPEEYVKAALLGGAIGAGVGGVTRGIIKVAESYLPRTGTAELPRSGQPTATAETLTEQGRSSPTTATPTTASPTTASPATEPGTARAATTARVRELGLRPQAIDALESFENIKRDPIGEVNREPNHNHYKASRREANNEVVARRPDGRPFNHIRDLQEHYLGLDNVRQVLEAEIEHPSPGMTERGLEVLLSKYSELHNTMSRLKGFLDGIGYGPPFPPFRVWPPGA